jgi:hypothetical protein
MTRTPVIALAVTALALTLAACSATPEDSPSGSAPAPEPAPTVTVTVTETPDAVATPDYGFTFFEQAELGHTFAEASAALNMPVAGAMECPYYGSVWDTQLATTWAYTDSLDPGAPIELFYTQQFLGSPSDSWPRNAEGVGIGSTQAEILAAYPDAVAGVVEDLGAGTINTLTVEDPDSDSKYVFGFSWDNPTVDLLQWGPNAGGQWSHLCGGF